MAVIPTPLTAADRAGGWWWELIEQYLKPCASAIHAPWPA
jgi:hypothetical protein